MTKREPATKRNINIEGIRKAVTATRNALRSHFVFSEVYLFGSYAGGAVNRDSDIDLCFVSEKKVDAWEAQIEVRKVIFDLLDTPLDILIYEKSQFYERANQKSTMEYEISHTGVLV